jgi:hypothetical protein
MGTLPTGAFAGVDWLGMRPTLWLCAAVLLVAPLPALASPLRTWREFSRPVMSRSAGRRLRPG